MVKVEIVEEKDHQANSPYASSSSSRTSSSVSLSSVDSDVSVEESFFDRVAALKDIVPPTTRHNIASRVSKTASFVKRSGKLLGNVIWVVTTTTLLIGLPLALIIEDESKAEAQEREMLEQQQGAQQVRPHPVVPMTFRLTYVSLPTCTDDGSVWLSIRRSTKRRCPSRFLNLRHPTPPPPVVRLNHICLLHPVYFYYSFIHVILMTASGGTCPPPLNPF